MTQPAYRCWKESLSRLRGNYGGSGQLTLSSEILLTFFTHPNLPAPTNRSLAGSTSYELLDSSGIMLVVQARPGQVSGLQAIPSMVRVPNHLVSLGGWSRDAIEQALHRSKSTTSRCPHPIAR